MKIFSDKKCLLLLSYLPCPKRNTGTKTFLLTSGKHLIQENSFFYENASVQDHSMISFTTFIAF